MTVDLSRFQAVLNEILLPDGTNNEAAENEIELTRFTAIAAEIVIARYMESLRWLPDLAKELRGNVVYTVYNKGCMLDDRYVGTVPNVSVVHLPNVGKEGHTWLWHIVNHYDSLAERTTFFQGSPYAHLPAGMSLHDYVRAPEMNATEQSIFLITGVAKSNLHGLAFRTGYFPYEGFSGSPRSQNDFERLNPNIWKSMRAVCGGWQRNTSLVDYSKVAYSVKNEVSPECPRDALPMLNITLQWILDVFDREPGTPSLQEFWEELEIGVFPSYLYHAQGAQFTLTRKRIRSRPKEFYQRLLKSVSQSKNPVEGYYLELVWFYIFFHEGRRG